MCGLYDNRDMLFSFTLVYVHADDADCLLIALQEVSSCQRDSSGRKILYFLTLLCI